MSTETIQSGERRRFRRFPVSLRLAYRLRAGVSGTGETTNVSSGGLLFRCATILPVAELIEVDLEWPFLYDKRHPLLLRVCGMTLRSSTEGTAMSISRHEYRLGAI